MVQIFNTIDPGDDDEGYPGDEDNDPTPDEGDDYSEDSDA